MIEHALKKLTPNGLCILTDEGHCKEVEIIVLHLFHKDLSSWLLFQKPISHRLLVTVKTFAEEQSQYE